MVAHAEHLIGALADAPGCRLLRLQRATTVPGQTVLGGVRPAHPGAGMRCRACDGLDVKALRR